MPGKSALPRGSSIPTSCRSMIRATCPEPAGQPTLLWFSMPYIDGESLRERLGRDRQLPVARGDPDRPRGGRRPRLRARQGLIHRDIKPENILLSGGHALVADFGVARALAPGTGEQAALTGTGLAIGTPAYMSPEQATGEHSLDERSDLYSLGCVLYEMLAGEPPFGGPTAARHPGADADRAAPPARAPFARACRP